MVVIGRIGRTLDTYVILGRKIPHLTGICILQLTFPRLW